MRNLLAFAAFLVLTFAIVGWYMDWYHIEREPSQSKGHHSVTIDVNTPKIVEDVEHGEERIHKAIENHSSTGTSSKADTDVPAIDSNATAN